MRRVYIKLHKEELEALVKLAELHRRHPSAEAGELLAKVLKRHVSAFSVQNKESAPCQR